MRVSNSAMRDRKTYFSAMGAQLPRCEDCALRGVALCGTYLKTAAEEYAGLPRTFEKVAARRLIYRAGTIPSSVFTLRDGWAFSFQVLSDGRRQIFDVFVPGDLIGLFGLPVRALTMSVQALVDVSLCGFELPRMLERGLRHRVFADDFRRRLGDYTRALESRIVDISRYPAASRIASLVLYLRGKLAHTDMLKGDVFEFPLTQNHVADALGLTAAHVNRMLRELRSQGILSLAQGRMTILDAERLSDLAKCRG